MLLEFLLFIVSIAIVFCFSFICFYIALALDERTVDQGGPDVTIPIHCMVAFLLWVVLSIIGLAHIIYRIILGVV